MKKLATALVLGFGAMVSSPASATTFIFDLSGDYAPTSSIVNFVSGPLQLAAQGYTYSSSVSDFITATTFSGLSPVATNTRGISGFDGGVSVCVTGDNSCNQIETDGSFEMLRLSFSLGTHALKSVILAAVDTSNTPTNTPDTLRIFGVSGDSLFNLGFGGSGPYPTIASIGTDLGDGVYQVNIGSSTYVDSFLFGGNGTLGDGYRVVGIEVDKSDKSAVVGIEVDKSDKKKAVFFQIDANDSSGASKPRPKVCPYWLFIPHSIACTLQCKREPTR